MTVITTPRRLRGDRAPAASRSVAGRPADRLAADGVVAGYLHDISTRRGRARSRPAVQAAPALQRACRHAS